MDPQHEKELHSLSEILKDSTAKLSEHFDSVQVFASRMDDSGDVTSTFKWGAGNWYSRYGMVKEWINMAEEDSKMKARYNRNESEEM